MITEDYVSFETAKLLKKKKFNELAYKYYTDEGRFKWVDARWHLDGQRNSCLSIPTEERFVAPTHQMVMKWLREVHNIHITINYSAFLYGTHPYYWSVDKMDPIPRANTRIETSTNTHDYSFMRYETACEAAIKYCLENLI